MSRGFKVKEMVSGKIYETMSAAERDLNLPGGTVSDAIKRNYKTHGYVFKLIPKDGQSSTEPEVVRRYKIEDTPEEFELLEESNTGISIRSALIKLHKAGYACDSYEGKLTVYNIRYCRDKDALLNLIDTYGYIGPCVITCYSDRRYKYYREYKK